MIHLTRRGQIAVFGSFAIGYAVASFISFRSAQADAKFYEGLSTDLPVFVNPGEAKVYKSSLQGQRTSEKSVRTPVLHRAGKVQNAPVKRLTRTFSVYADKYIGRNMANGQPYRETGYTVASNDWPLGTKLILRVNNKHAHVTVTDRMAKRFSGRRVDLSQRVWDHLSGAALPGLIRGTVEETK